MPATVQPELIEVSDFTGGWAPDGEDAFMENNLLLDTLNVLIDRNSKALVARPGFERILAPLTGEGRWVLELFHMFAGFQDAHYIIAVTTDGSTDPNNVQLWAIDVVTGDSDRMDTAGVTWANPLAHHWGTVVDKVFYGGSHGNEMYSWDPDGPTWNDDAGFGNWRAWVADIDDDVDTTNEYGRDFAWTGKEKTTLSGDIYQPNKSIRYDAWDDDRHYSKGARVSRKHVWDTSSTYWKSFRCTDPHMSSNPIYDPGTGASWHDVWEVVRLAKPKNSDGETDAAWNFVPTAAPTSVGVWHANRLFLRFDGEGKDRLQYSAPVKPDKGEDIPDTVWHPTDWAPGDDMQGQGGGWLPFSDGRTSGVIEALVSYGQYLIVFKRRNVWALSGSDDSTWTTRHIASDCGTIGPKGAIELDGLVYFLSDDGLYKTDGTAAVPVEGNEKIQRWLRDRMDATESEDESDTRTFDPELHAFDGFIFISLPGTDNQDEEFVTVVYHPETQSFWYTDLPIRAGVVFRDQGITKFAFGAHQDYGEGADIVYLYDAGATEDDDGDSGTATPVPIAWHVRCSWWPFGVAREERRIRKVWALVRGDSQTMTLNSRRNYDDTVVTDTDRTVDSDIATFIEGEWFADSYSVNFEVEGTAAPAALYSVAVRTQRRRARYHN